MGLHELLPLIAFFLNASLFGISLLRNSRSRLNRMFACFVSGLAVWNLGVFLLRQAPDEPTAHLWEIVIHAGVILIPALYYHFVLVFLERTSLHRRTLTLAYGLALVFSAVNVSGSAAFLTGVTWTYWGWAPAVGFLYYPFLLYWNAFMIYGFVHLLRAHRAIESSFRRNRGRLILLGTCLSLSGGVVDFVRFIAARFLPAADTIYPVGIPANMLFALMIGVSIVRYRLFDVNVAVKKAVVYMILGGALTSALVAGSWTLERFYGWTETTAVSILILISLVITLLVSPLGRSIDDAIQGVMFSRRRGCYETLLDLSRRMSTILNFDALVDTLIRGLVRGIPLTHCALMTYDRATNAFVPFRREAAIDSRADPEPIPTDSAVVRWLARSEGVLVKEEAALDPTMTVHFESTPGELERIPASLVVPLRVESALIGILLLGEKLSGEIFDSQELDLLLVMASQAATALENARLYQEIRQAYDELSRTQHQLIQAQKMEAVGRLAGGVAHDFNNLLTVILGRSQLLLFRLAPDDPVRRHVELIHKTGERAATLTGQLLAFSRKQLLQPRVLSLNTVVAGVEKMLRRLIGEDIELLTVTSPALGHIEADRGQLEQVILNLSVNARDAMPEGGQLTIETANVDLDEAFVRHHPGSRPGPHVMLAVSDTGVGMSPEIQIHLFEPFFTTKEIGKGTGLGLATVYGIVQQHGGCVAAESAPGRGTTFRVYLPRVETPAESVEPTPGVTGGARGSETVLLVEDEPGLRELAQEILQTYGYTVLTAQNGGEALGACRRYADPIHLVVTDVVMPQMSGGELAERLGSLRPDTKLLFISGYTDDAIAHHRVLDRETAFLHKPFTPEALVRKVREVLDAPRADTTGAPSSVGARQAFSR